MEIPANAEVTETQSSIYWFEKELLCIVGKNSPEIPFEKRKEETEKFLNKLQGKKVCAVMDISQTSPTSKQGRDYNSEQLPKMFKAIAFISKTSWGKMLTNLYLGLRPMPFPTKVFSNEKEARDWIKQYQD